MDADHCTTGSHLAFHGVQLSSRARPGYAVNLVLPEDGQDHLTFTSPGHRPVVIPQASCSVWRVEVHNTGTSHNTTEDQAVHAEFDCTIAGQLHIAGHVVHPDCG